MCKISYIVIFLRIFFSYSEDVLFVTLLPGFEMRVCFSDRNLCSATYAMLDYVLLGRAHLTYFTARRKKLRSRSLEFVVYY